MTKYTPEIIRFMGQSLNKTSSDFELAELVNEKFGTSFTTEQIKGARRCHGLPRREKKNAKWTPEITRFIKENVQTAASIKGMVAMVNAHFGTRFTFGQINGVMWRIGLKTGKKICISRPIYSERVNNKGHIQVKVSMTGPKSKRWKGKHDLVWEAANGPVPEGCIIIFADRNNRNFDLHNLLCVSKRELFYMSRYGLLTGNAESTRICHALAKHRLALIDAVGRLTGDTGNRPCMDKYRRSIQEKKA